MACLIILIIYLISAFTFNFVECSTEPMTPGFKVSIVENIEDFLKENPRIESKQLDVIREEIFDGISSRSKLKHKHGNRIAGDRLLGENEAKKQWTTPQDVQLTLSYPNDGIGAVITYLEVIVDQSSDLGKAYVTNGGIGQRFIEIVVEAKSTLYFNYKASIYGF